MGSLQSRSTSAGSHPKSSSIQVSKKLVGDASESVHRAMFLGVMSYIPIQERAPKNEESADADMGRTHRFVRRVEGRVIFYVGLTSAFV